MVRRSGWWSAPLFLDPFEDVVDVPVALFASKRLRPGTAGERGLAQLQGVLSLEGVNPLVARLDPSRSAAGVVVVEVELPGSRPGIERQRGIQPAAIQDLVPGDRPGGPGLECHAVQFSADDLPLALQTLQVRVGGIIVIGGEYAGRQESETKKENARHAHGQSSSNGRQPTINRHRTGPLRGAGFA